jgi:hypothetical protein
MTKMTVLQKDLLPIGLNWLRKKSFFRVYLEADSGYYKKDITWYVFCEFLYGN